MKTVTKGKMNTERKISDLTVRQFRTILSSIMKRSLMSIEGISDYDLKQIGKGKRK